MIYTAVVEAAYARSMGYAGKGETPAIGDLALLTEAGRDDLVARVERLLEEKRPIEPLALVGGMAFTIRVFPCRDRWLAHADAIDHDFSRDLHRAWNNQKLAYDAMIRLLEQEIG